MACFNKNPLEDSCSLSDGKLTSKEQVKRHTTSNETFFKMLQDYRPVVMGVIGTDQRSPGPGDFIKGIFYILLKFLIFKVLKYYFHNYTTFYRRNF